MAAWGHFSCNQNTVFFQGRTYQGLDFINIGNDTSIDQKKKILQYF